MGILFRVHSSSGCVLRNTWVAAATMVGLASSLPASAALRGRTAIAALVFPVCCRSCSVSASSLERCVLVSAWWAGAADLGFVGVVCEPRPVHRRDHAGARRLELPPRARRAEGVERELSRRVSVSSCRTSTPARAGNAATMAVEARCFTPSRLTLTRIAVPALVLACGPLLLGSPQSDRKAADTKWTVSRTPDGHPDLQGMWTNYDPTPFERLGPGEQFPRDLAVSTADWLVQDSPKSPRRPSMVVDPPNGRVPLKPEAIESQRRDSCAQPSNVLERYGPWERCITRGVPGVDDAQRVQQRPSDRADVELHRVSLRDDP